MTTTEAPPAPADLEEQVGALAERLFLAGLGAFELGTIYLGRTLGLYAALADRGPLTAAELAGAAGIDARYAQEWLDQQAAAGLLTVDDVDADPGDRRYAMPAALTEVVLDEDSLAFLGTLPNLAMGLGQVASRLVEVYRTGEGIPFAEFGADVGEGQAGFNRPAFVNLLASEWLATGAPDIDERLRARPPARVLDVGCGHGWSAVALARAYPHVEVVATDLDEASIDQARQNAAEAGVADRTRFVVADAADPVADGPFDAAFVFEAIHDLPRPVEALASIRAALVGGGTLVVMDERAAERFTAPADELERLMFSASVLHCLPVGRAQQPSAATGTMLRPDTFRRYAAEAGFGGVEILPIEHDFFRFYRLEA